MEKTAARAGTLAVIYALTILISAFLLFQVQPLLSKWILPWFGGGPAVWTTAMLFFQSALFAGYAYAHFSERYLKAPVQMVVHLVLIVLALGMLPITPGEEWKPAPQGSPTWQILVLLGVNVGVPYFLLSSTGPLVQAWFARVYPGRSPYRLYALSNIGSLAALLTYPFLFEPLWGLQTQATFWYWGFVVLAVLYACGTYAAWRVGQQIEASAPGPAVAAADGLLAPPTTAEADNALTGPPTWWQRALWIALPAFASLMLLATTNQLCQDVAVIPFLWILPLALYLLSFIIAFDHPRWYRRLWFAPATGVCIMLAAVAYGLHASYTLIFLFELTVTLLSLFGLCMLCHGELVRLKPPSKYLTGYYLAISGGGALGGILISVVAPNVFTTFMEWKIGALITFVGAMALVAYELWPSWKVKRPGVASPRFSGRQTIALAVLAALSVGGVIVMCLSLEDHSTNVAYRSRNFYGTLKVYTGNQTAGGERYLTRCLVNGRILHGEQFLPKEFAYRPTTYYVEDSGIGRAIQFFRARPDMRIGVVGLGVGTLAAYIAQPTQKILFYEINPDVAKVAYQYFTFLRDCPGIAEVALGDARLSLERQESQQYHVLVLDAFSGDAIPTHLLTREAMQTYVKHLAPDGILAVHVSNRFLDLAPVVRGLVHTAGFKTVEVRIPRMGYASESDWILCTKDPKVLEELNQHKTPRWKDDDWEIVWTDDFSDLASILKIRQLTWEQWKDLFWRTIGWGKAKK